MGKVGVMSYSYRNNSNALHSAPYDIHHYTCQGFKQFGTLYAIAAQNIGSALFTYSFMIIIGLMFLLQTWAASY